LAYLQRKQVVVPEWMMVARVLFCGYRKLTVEETCKEMQKPVQGDHVA
jgi:hypothetical protein